MKKTIFVLLLVGVTMLGFSQAAVIKDLTGTVELKPSGASDFIPAAIGAEVLQNTIISTGFKSSALVQVGSAVITVRPLTRLTLTEIQASQVTEILNVNLQSGRVRVDLNPTAGSKASLGVSSPIATASVRGTSFDFDTRNLYVHSGVVAFIGKWGYQVLVQGGFNSSIGASGTAEAAQSSFGGSGFMSRQWAGYDNAAGTTGGSGVVSDGDKEKTPSAPPPNGNTPGGGKGNGSGDNPPQPPTGGVGITVTFE